MLATGGEHFLTIDLGEDWQAQERAALPPSAADKLPLPMCPVVGVQDPSVATPDTRPSNTRFPEFVDLVVDSDRQLEAVRTVINKCPHAATLLVQLLRQTESMTIAQGLFAESLAYSTLQHGVEFTRWLNEQPAPNPAQQSFVDGPEVRVARMGDRLQIVLNRPERRNAFSAAMRDLLCEALEVACFDNAIEEVCLAGAGTAFCAGGDLREFGQARDAGIAHLSRSTRSAGALLHRLRDRVRVTVQGACVGAGVELPAFAGTIQARPDSFFSLPEVSLGLVPGAGGCVSLPRRIGRHRTALMALTGGKIDAQQALEWGLVDEIVLA